jgi:hypothetical protein
LQHFHLIDDVDHRRMKSLGSVRCPRILRDVAGCGRIRPGIAAVVASSCFFTFAAARSAFVTVVWVSFTEVFAS